MAMPTLTVAQGATPGKRISPKAARNRSPIRSASSIETFGKRQANSSPPTRLNRSPGRTEPSDEACERPQQDVSGLVPRGVVDFLEAVEIEQQQRGRAAIGDCPREEPLAEIEEGAAVGDAGK